MFKPYPQPFPLKREREARRIKKVKPPPPFLREGVGGRVSNSYKK